MRPVSPWVSSFRASGPMLAVLLLFAAHLFVAQAATAQLATLRNLEARLLDTRLDEYELADQRARQAEEAYRSLRQRLSSVLGDSGTTLDRLRELEAQTSEAREIAFLRDREATALRREIYTLLERVAELDRELAGGGPDVTGPWTIDFGGRWGRGSVTLRTTADRVEGRYQLEDGRSGLLRGEIIGRTVILMRYDTRGEEQLELRGTLSADLGSMAGNWVAREMASGADAIGIWSAVRQD